MDPLRIVIAGVGGQGTLLASRLIAEAAIKAGYPVKIGETYGMAQRGGPVMSHITIGEASSPQICPGDADVLLGFEEAESVRRGVTYLKRNGLALVNTRRMPPAEVVSGMVKYPNRDILIGLLSEVTNRIISFDATALAEEAGDPIATNMVMLGALCASGVLPFPEKVIINVLKWNLPQRYHSTNLKAFKLGQTAVQRQIDNNNR
ncbi:indolepyruvate oxidoreductase subunit beta [Candidatus Bathyarchaeota archaeon]|nr:indolepyruvate oxidoreductase subunit beta [Candidatus Bathyarchaeota archaeon]MBS7630520.1 indolepyruvate oxidoreductase subunit beta [Candidatus Bathyarchaeota archaeon]